MIRQVLLAAGLAGLVGCGAAPPPPPPRTIAAESPPPGGLWMTVGGRAEHPTPVGHGMGIAWVPAGWVVADGAEVATGDPLLRYDVEALTQWQDNDRHDIIRDEQRRALELLRSEGDIERLRSRLHALAARRAVIVAQLDAARRTDPDEIAIAERQLADARAEHSAARLRLDRLDRLYQAGAPVSLAELARAREEEVRARTAQTAPEVALELARLPASRATVRRLELELDDIDAQFGATPEAGLQAQLRTAQERRAKQEIDRGRGRSARRARSFHERELALADPELRSRADGIAALRDEGVRIGAKLPRGASSVLVLDTSGLRARLEVPEHLRPLVGPGSRLAIRTAAEARVLAARVETIAPLPETSRDGRRVVATQVRIDNPPPGLRQGMSVDCEVAVDVGPGAALVPGFCLADSARHEVVMADGGRRVLDGFVLGGWFVALSGIAPGERMRLPEGDGAARPVRVSAMVEPARFVPVRLRSWHWEVLELLPEGTAVRAGDRIARMVKTEWWRPAEQIRANVEITDLQSRLDLSIAQLAATEERANAATAWVRTRLARDRARIDAWITRNAYDAVGEARTAATLAQRQVAVERARRELAAAEEENAAGGISANRLREHRIAFDRAVSALDRARLDAAAESLGRDWLELQTADDGLRNAAGAEEAARAQATLAGEVFRIRLADAAARFAGTRRWMEADLRQLADEEVLAPADGILVYTRGGSGPPAPGQPIHAWEPFRIADGTERRATFEMPARLSGRFAVGDRLRLDGPSLSRPVEGEVLAIANAYLPPSSFAEEVALGRTVGVEDRVFHVTVGISPDAGTDLPPGALVHVDL